MQENLDNLADEKAFHKAYASLAKVGRHLLAEEATGRDPESVSSSMESFKALVLEIAKMQSLSATYSVWLISLPLGAKAYRRHRDAEIGPAPLEKINPYLRAIQIQHELAGAEMSVQLMPVDDGTPAWLIEYKYPTVSIMLCIFEEAAKDEA